MVAASFSKILIFLVQGNKVQHRRWH